MHVSGDGSVVTMTSPASSSMPTLPPNRVTWRAPAASTEGIRSLGGSRTDMLRSSLPNGAERNILAHLHSYGATLPPVPPVPGHLEARAVDFHVEDLRSCRSGLLVWLYTTEYWRGFTTYILRAHNSLARWSLLVGELGYDSFWF
jgi:hypothetical protein